MAYVSIEGNIGAGKSTFIKTFADVLPDIEWVTEPVEEWRSLGQQCHNVLTHYYENPQRWGLTFQLYVIGTRIRKLSKSIQALSQNKQIIMERSTQADQRVFSRLMKVLGYMNQMQYQIFCDLYPQKDEQNHKIIYLRCSAQTCLKRIQARSRQQEQKIPIEYLRLIDDLHKQWINEIVQNSTKKQQIKNSQKHQHITRSRKVLIIDAQADYRQGRRREEISKEIRLFLD